jgi:hypothetical protein
MSITTTITLALQIASTRNRRRRLSSLAVVFGSTETLTTTKLGLRACSKSSQVSAKLAEVQENLNLIDHKIDVYRGRLVAGDADQLWAPNRLAGAR